MVGQPVSTGQEPESASSLGSASSWWLGISFVLYTAFSRRVVVGLPWSENIKALSCQDLPQPAPPSTPQPAEASSSSRPAFSSSGSGKFKGKGGELKG